MLAQPDRIPAAADVPSRRDAAEDGPGVGRLSLSAATWLGSFVVLAAVLLVRNAYLFSARIYENQDYAANTIAILQAKRFTLLTGNYSKNGFYHPGPAFLYVEAGGESFFHDLLHVVPTPWNGQLLAILLLNAAIVAAALSVLARHAGSRQVPLAGLAVTLLFTALHPLPVNTEWMPYVYFAPTLLLVASAASVIAGQTADLPLLALSAGLCINGHAEFLLFAPVTVLVSLAALMAWNHRDLRGTFRGRAGHWAAALTIGVLLLLPTALNTVLHWPGQFGKYFGYARAASVHHLINHSLAYSAGYVMRYWWPGTPASSAGLRGLIVCAALSAIALALALHCPAPALRRFLLCALASAALLTALFIYDARRGINDNDIKQAYLGYFYWAAPLLVAIVAVAGAAVHLNRRRAAALAVTAAVAGSAVVAAAAPQVLDNIDDPPASYRGDPQLPREVRALVTAAHGRTMVLNLVHNDWMDAVGAVAYADRTGLRACVTGEYWAVLFRAQSLCTRTQARVGTSFWFTPPGERPPVRGLVTVVTFPHAVVTRLPR